MVLPRRFSHYIFIQTPFVILDKGGHDSQKGQLCQPLTLSNTDLLEFLYSTTQYISRWFLY